MSSRKRKQDAAAGNARDESKQGVTDAVEDFALRHAKVWSRLQQPLIAAQGPVALSTLLGWDSNSSNDGYEQGHWNPVTDPRPSMWENVSTLAGVKWGELKQRYNDLVRQNLPRLKKARSLLAHASGLPEDD